MERIYHPYWLWEDYQNGMYDNDLDDTKIDKSKSLLTNVNLFYKTMLQVMDLYPISTDCNLSNKSCNRKAWLGQSACNLLHKATEKQVRIAWSMMDLQQQVKANIKAEQIIKIYEARYNRLHKGVGTEMLF